MWSGVERKRASTLVARLESLPIVLMIRCPDDPITRSPDLPPCLCVSVVGFPRYPFPNVIHRHTRAENRQTDQRIAGITIDGVNDHRGAGQPEESSRPRIPRHPTASPLPPTPQHPRPTPPSPASPLPPQK